MSKQLLEKVRLVALVAFAIVFIVFLNQPSAFEEMTIVGWVTFLISLVEYVTFIQDSVSSILKNRRAERERGKGAPRWLEIYR